MALIAISSAVLYAVFIWWFSTGAILWLDRRPRTTYRASLTLATGLAAIAIYGLVKTMGDDSPTGAVLAFTSALGIWGWHELAFLTGLIAGPRTSRCPADATGWRRFALAASTLIYHEIALALTAVTIVAVTWGEPNQIACWTFLILFVSRLSAKLNLFYGVPNFTDEFFPDHLRYLTSYIRKSRASGLFPISIGAGAAIAGAEAWAAFHPGASPFAAVGNALLFALTVLALTEHGFMVMPLPDAALWRWMLPPSAKSGNG